MSKVLIALVVLSSFLNFFHRHPSEPAASIEAIQRVQASVVHIHGVKPMVGGYSCSGWVEGQDRVLTAAHCVGDHMTVDGIAATVLKHDEYFDVALLKVHTDREPLHLRLRPVEFREWLVGIGYAFGWDRLTTLDVRVILRDYAVDHEGAVGNLVQGAYIEGMSGGPVVDHDGLVVGMIQQANDGVGFGVGTQIISTFLLGS